MKALSFRRVPAGILSLGWLSLPVLAQTESDPLAGLQDIIGPIPPPPWWTTPLGIATISAAGLLAAFLMFLAVRKALSQPKRVATPSERALQGFADLRLRMGEMAPDAVVAAASDLLRRFLAEQYSLHAREQTTPEFLASISNAGRFNEAQKQTLQRYLERCDLVKFAQVETGPQECQRLIDEAVQFVAQASPGTEGGERRK